MATGGRPTEMGGGGETEKTGSGGRGERTTGGSDTGRGGGEMATGGSDTERGGGGERATGGSVIGRGGGGERATGGSTLGSDILELQRALLSVRNQALRMSSKSCLEMRARKRVALSSFVGYIEKLKGHTSSPLEKSVVTVRWGAQAL